MLVLAVFLLCAGVVSGAEYIHVWNKTAGGSQDDRGYDVATDSQDNIIVTGRTDSFGAGSYDFWTIKYDPNGVQLWSKTAGGSLQDYGSGVAIDSQDNVIVTGYTDSPAAGITYILTIKYDEDGNVLWNKTISKTVDDYGFSVTTDSQDNIIVAGMASSNFWTIKYDPNGVKLWDRTAGGSQDDRGYDVATDSQDNVIVTGYFSSSGAILEDFLTIKYDKDGNTLWSKITGGSGYDVGQSAVIDSQDNIIVAGKTNSFGAGNNDFWTIKYNPNGVQLWNRTVGGSNDDYAWSAAKDSQDNIIITGYTTSFGAGSNDFWTIGYDKDGNMLWNKTAGGSGYDVGYGVATDSQDNVIVTGITQSFGGGTGEFWTIKYRYNCTTCPKDISLTDSDIFFLKKQGNEVNISATVHNGNTDIGQAEVEFIESSNGILVKNKTITVTDITARGTKTASLVWNLASGNTVYVFVDPDDKIDESNDDNNYASKEYIGLPKFYVEADVGLTKINAEIEDFIEDNLKFGFPVDNSEEADVLIAAARHNPLVMLSLDTLDRGWGFEGNGVKNQGRTESKPYGAVVGSLDKDGKHHIYIEGNDVEGFIAGAKELVKQEDRFIEGEDSYLIDENNIDALAVYDYLHTPVNLPYYKKNSNAFAGIVGKALNGSTFKSNDTTISLGWTTLRLKNLEPVKSDLFKNYTDSNQIPVVLAGGLWSDISAWETLGGELSDKGYDVYLIELTGGPGMECDLCEDYTYDNLTNSVLPAYVNQIKTLSGKNKIRYVGHSNGARVALDALTSGKVNPNDVDTLVLVGVPGNFSELSFFASIVDQSGDIAINNLRNQNVSHITFSKVAHEMEGIVQDMIALFSLFTKQNKISVNLFEKYYNWIHLTNDAQPGKDLSLNYFTLIYGTDGFLLSKANDQIVSVIDEIVIYNNINSSAKKIKDVKQEHTGMTKNDEIKDYVKRSIDKSIY